MDPFRIEVDARQEMFVQKAAKASRVRRIEADEFVQ
jgi:hypothetical protein